MERSRFIEATYRWRGHVGPDENIDVGIRRSEIEIKKWKKRDPIKRLEDALLLRDVSNKHISTIKSKIFDEVTAAVKFAHEQPFPKDIDLFKYVYCE